MSIIIWDKLPDCILDKIYEKIYLSQPKNLLDDIVSYKFTINYIKELYSLLKGDDNTYWKILWQIVLYFEVGDNKHKNLKMINMKDFVMNNNNIMIRYEGGLYWVKKYIIKMTKNDRYNFIDKFNLYLQEILLSI
tara:strand:- start:341 stop:745 length:405 start_codon:yes stop_codon:yes gene_type:complete